MTRRKAGVYNSEDLKALISERSGSSGSKGRTRLDGGGRHSVANGVVEERQRGQPGNQGAICNR